MRHYEAIWDVLSALYGEDTFVAQAARTLAKRVEYHSDPLTREAMIAQNCHEWFGSPASAAYAARQLDAVLGGPGIHEALGL